MHREMKLGLTWNTPQRKVLDSFPKTKDAVQAAGSEKFTYPVVDPACYNTELLVKLCLWVK